LAGLPAAGISAAARWAGLEEEAGTGIFRVIEALGADVGQAAAFLFCDGPGSTLGVRTAAVALRTWQVVAPRPVYAYHSLAVLAEAIGRPARR
jgi:tRNA threonylcarbamoyladenosine biosynthesis protein TsaB